MKLQILRVENSYKQLHPKRFITKCASTKENMFSFIFFRKNTVDFREYIQTQTNIKSIHLGGGDLLYGEKRIFYMKKIYSDLQ